MIDKLKKMKKINVALIISVLIFFVSVIGFVFNTSVRITPIQDMIIVDEGDSVKVDEDLDVLDGFERLFNLLPILVGIPILLKLWKKLFEEFM